MHCGLRTLLSGNQEGLLTVSAWMMKGIINNYVAWTTGRKPMGSRITIWTSTWHLVSHFIGIVFVGAEAVAETNVASANTQWQVWSTLFSNILPQVSAVLLQSKKIKRIEHITRMWCKWQACSTQLWACRLHHTIVFEMNFLFRNRSLTCCSTCSWRTLGRRGWKLLRVLTGNWNWWRTCSVEGNGC